MDIGIRIWFNIFVWVLKYYGVCCYSIKYKVCKWNFEWKKRELILVSYLWRGRVCIVVVVVVVERCFFNCI